MADSIPLEQRFIVLSCPRTGSTWFNSLLDSHPEIQCFGHLLGHSDGLVDRFEPIVRRENGEEVFREFYLMRPYGKVHGFTLHGHHLRIQLIRPLMQSIRKAIISTRTNKTEQAISNIHAEDSKIWFLDSSYEEKEQQHIKKIASSPVYVDIEKVNNWIHQHERLLRQRIKWAEHLGYDFLNITYEELCQDLPNVSKRVTEFLGVSYCLLTSSLQKMHNKGYGFITNIDEVNEKLGPEFGYLNHD